MNQDQVTVHSVTSVLQGIRAWFKPTVRIDTTGQFDELMKAYVIMAQKVGGAAEDFGSISRNLADGVQSICKMYGRFEMAMDISTSLLSIVQFCRTEDKTDVVYALPALWSVYKLIKLMLDSMPREWCCWQEDVYEDARDMVAEANDLLTSMSYAAIINILPKPVVSVLTTFAKFSRIKLLDDLAWLGQIAVAVLSIPAYVLNIVRVGVSAINYGSKLSGIIALLEQAEHGYMNCINFLPSMQLNASQTEVNEIVARVERSRMLLHDPSIMEEMEQVARRATTVALTLTEMQSNLPEAFRAQRIRLDGLIRASKVLCDTSRPEPVAIVFYSGPGKGKTYLVQMLKRVLGQDPNNTIYDYRPVNETHDFHDHYANQTVWVHEDLAQGGAKDWAQYIHHISNAKSPLDAAQADRKQTCFFNSRIILATTNLALHREGALKPEPNCGWKYIGAVKRRWLVVDMSTYDYQKDPTATVPVYRYDYTHTNKYEEVAQISLTGQGLVDFISDELREKDRVYKAMLDYVDGQEYEVPNFNIHAEGRRIGVVTTEEPVTFDYDIRDERTLVTYVNPCRDVLERGDRISVINRILDSGKYISGKRADVDDTTALIVTTTVSEWEAYVMARRETTIDSIIRQCTEFWKAFRDQWVKVEDRLVEYRHVGVILALAGTLIAGYCVRQYFKQESSALDRIIHQQSYPSKKKQSASKLYAEGLEHIPFTECPNDTVDRIKQHILYADITSGSKRSSAFLTILDHAHIMLPLHTVVNEDGDVEESVFVRGMDGSARVKIEAYYVMVDYAIREDWAILRRKNPAAPLFSSIHRAVKKEPTSTEIYLVTPYGAVSLGEPRRTDVIGNYYKFRNGVASLTDMAIRYDQHAPGLCGALIVTKCGYIFGWHVATSQTTGWGYARPWVKHTRDFIESLPVSSGKLREDKYYADIKGAIPIRGTYVRVSANSTIVPSAMYEYNRETTELVDDQGELFRAPAQLEGVVDGEDVYDRARKKNLKVTTGRVNLSHMKVVKEYIKHLVRKVMGGQKIKPLTNEEIVNGTTGNPRLKGVNKEASAGIPFGGLVGECVDDGKIRDDVLALMTSIEDKARKGVKDFDVIFKDCAKDELRAKEKTTKPRIFAAGPVHFTMLIRKYFGRLCVKCMELRHEIGIMIGMNATSAEWNKMYNRLRLLKNVFDGDYKEWDGGMLKEFQEILNEVLSEESEDPMVAAVILSFLSETIRAGKDLTYMTTHSVPSGHGMTSLYNSLINKMYQFYAWMELVGQHLGLSIIGLIATFERQIYGPVYGDDVAMGVHDEITGTFNAITYAKVMTDLGLGFTNAQKQPPSSSFMPLSEITFLKRSFYFNDRIGQVVGPLSIDVLKTTTSWTHDITRDDEIAAAKMDSIQRELYLHPYVEYLQVWTSLKRNYEKAYGYASPELSEQQIQQLYTAGEFNTVELFIH